jgi:hypothetical protein
MKSSGGSRPKLTREQAAEELAKRAKRASESPGYEAYKSKQAKISRARSAAGRDIGPIPPIRDLLRRERGRESLKIFCESYNPIAFKPATIADSKTKPCK